MDFHDMFGEWNNNENTHPRTTKKILYKSYNSVSIVYSGFSRLF